MTILKSKVMILLYDNYEKKYTIGIIVRVTLGCFHSCPRLQLTFTIIAMQKSGSHPPFIPKLM